MLLVSKPRCHVLTKRDTLDMQNMDMQHVVLEPNHKTVFGGHLQKMEGLLKQPKTRPKVGMAQGRK